MNPQLHIAFIGCLVNSALYLMSVVGVGIYTHNSFAYSFGIAAMGVTYLSYFWQVTALPSWFKIAIVGLSVVLGAVAGISLLVP